jgi:hypothetical protein
MNNILLYIDKNEFDIHMDKYGYSVTIQVGDLVPQKTVPFGWFQEMVATFFS